MKSKRNKYIHLKKKSVRFLFGARKLFAPCTRANELAGGTRAVYLCLKIGFGYEAANLRVAKLAACNCLKMLD